MPPEFSYLVLSILVLAAGPTLQVLAQRLPRLLRAVNLAVSAAVGLLVLLHILPEVVAEVGVIAVVAAAAGMAAPTLVERKLHRLATRAHATALLLAVAGIVLHGFIDGMAIATGRASSDALPVAILLHRIPAGMAVWFLVSNNHGRWLAVVALLGIAVATVIGFLTIDLHLSEPSSPLLAGFQALVAGSLLHALIHRPDDHHGHSEQAGMST